MRFNVELQYPWSFEKTVRRLRKFEKMSYTEHSGRFQRTVRGKKGPLLLSIDYDPNSSALQVQVTGETVPGEEAELHELVRRMFGADVDLTPFYEQMKHHPVIGEVVRSREGLHIVRDPTVFECLIKTIISQQLNVAFAGTLIRRLVELAGDRLEREGAVWPVFPSAEQVARLSYEDLQKLQFNRRKAEYVIDISRMVADGKLDLEALGNLPDEEVFDRLLPVRGVGRWTVECVLLFGLGRPDLLPAADIGLRNALKRLYGLQEQPDEQTVRSMGEEWKPYRSYVTFYLWDTLG
jgi:DNA-3-methyladenine glycosylase II